MGNLKKCVSFTFYYTLTEFSRRYAGGAEEGNEQCRGGNWRLMSTYLYLHGKLFHNCMLIVNCLQSLLSIEEWP